jgi:hypothetical protein
MKLSTLPRDTQYIISSHLNIRPCIATDRVEEVSLC